MTARRISVHPGFILAFYLALAFTQAENFPCNPREIEDRSVVCVCTATYCDTLDPLPTIPDGQFYHVVSDFDGKRFETSFEDLLTESPEHGSEADLLIDTSIKFQKMIGFGGAFTDAAGENFNNISTALKDRLMNAYFGKDGLEYNIARVPIGGSDFSSRPYAYCDNDDDDLELNCFELEPEDHDFKIPYILEGLEINPNIKLFASPWSAPAWMKSNGQLNGTGSLKPEYYQVWSDYFIRFLEEYQTNNITFWAVTAQNEPIHGFIGGGWNCMGWFPEWERDFIKHNLGPNLRANFPDVKLIILDDQRFEVLPWLRVILNDPEAAQYVAGVGVHWYANQYFPVTPLDIAHSEFPDYFMLNTEACTGFLHDLGVPPVDLGSWYRAELYAHFIIEDLNHWLQGWVEWNLVLNQEGGPNWAGNMVDAPIIINSEADEAYKQPMYYALGHFSKFIPENSVRVHSSGINMGALETLTVQREDGSVVVVVLNDKPKDVDLIMRDDVAGTILKVTIGSRSIHTIVYPSTFIQNTTTPISSTPEDEEVTTPSSSGANTNQFVSMLMGVVLLLVFLRN